MTKIDLVQLDYELRRMNRRQKIYQIVKKALKDRGFWKDKPRGNPVKGQFVMKENRNNNAENT